METIFLSNSYILAQSHPMSHLLPGQHEISLSYRACMLSFSQLFEQLRQARQAGTSSQSLTPDANNTEEVKSFEAGEKQLDDDLGRFTIWAENCGAHRHGRTSLDHRLREAADVKQMVLELLENLNEDLQDGMYKIFCPGFAGFDMIA
jgi:hypothetical protein